MWKNNSTQGVKMEFKPVEEKKNCYHYMNIYVCIQKGVEEQYRSTVLENWKSIRYITIYPSTSWCTLYSNYTTHCLRKRKERIVDTEWYVLWHSTMTVSSINWLTSTARVVVTSDVQNSRAYTENTQMNRKEIRRVK